MKIVIDAFGGDNSPEEIIEGAVLAVSKHKNLTIVLCGDEEKVKKVLNGREERIEVVHAPDVISNDDIPTDAIRHKKDSSLVKAFDILKNEDDVIALISAGSTGAILAGGIFKIGRISGISRPALAPILPTKEDSDVIMVDSGANIDCKPENLYQFALMGSAYYSIVYNNQSPRVGLLNIGVEEHKGTELVRNSYQLLKTAPINFIGNVEARDYMSGKVDVMVAEGFSGNVLLKGSEGAVGAVLSVMKKSIKSHFFSKIGALFMRKTFKEMKGRMDVLSRHGGSPLLGCKKIVMKNHGSSKRANISASVDEAILLHENKLIQKIQDSLGKKVEEQWKNLDTFLKTKTSLNGLWLILQNHLRTMRD